MHREHPSAARPPVQVRHSAGKPTHPVRKKKKKKLALGLLLALVLLCLAIGIGLVIGSLMFPMEATQVSDAVLRPAITPAPKI